MSGQEIIPLFDPPHLLKGIRNNLLTKDLEINWRKPLEERLTASWRTIVLTYFIDQQSPGPNHLKNLSDKHIFIEGKKKCV